MMVQRPLLTSEAAVFRCRRRIADYSLEDLLTPREIGDRVTASISSRHWTAGADFSFEMNPSAPLLKIRLPWGRLVVIDLITGRLQAAEAQSPVS